MVDATVAGVMFTANPVTGTRHETVIDASPGLGEAVVSGAVNPDHFVVDSRTGTVVARRAGRQAGRRPSAGPAAAPTACREPDRSAEPCLDDAQLLELAELGDRVQEHYGAPQDTEWALDADGRFWLTQARPITTLYPQPITRHAGDRLFLCLSLAQGLTRPITPMGLAAFRLIGSSVARLAGRPASRPGAGSPAPLAIARSAAVRRYHPGRPAPARPPADARRRPARWRRGPPRCSPTSPTTPASRCAGESPHAAVRPVARVVVLRAKTAAPRMVTALVSPRAAHAGDRPGRTSISVSP